jgi:hypothetical protein
MSEEPLAGRDLDAAVAQALGYTIYKVDYGSRRPEWAVVNTWDEWNERPYIDDRARGYGKITLPRFSQPKNIADRAALLECVLWLAKSGIGISIESDGTHVGPILTNIDGTGVWVVSVPGFDEAAFALAISRAVVKAASFFA